MSEENQDAALVVDKKRQTLCSILTGLAIVAGLFGVVMFILLTVNYLRLTQTDPLNAPHLVSLMTQAQAQPKNQSLTASVREMDLLARQAYFGSRRMAEAGAYYIMFSVIVMLLCLRSLKSMHEKEPDPMKNPANIDPQRALVASRPYVTAMGIVMFAVVFVLHLIYPGDTDLFVAAAHAAEQPEQTQTAMEPIQLAQAKPAAQPKPATTAAEAYPDWEALKKQWPTFRGPGGQGIAYTKDAPVKWDVETGDNVLWQVDVPLAGLNSPVIWDRRIYMSGADDESREVYCFDADSGKLLWREKVTDVPGSPDKLPEVTDDTGYAAPSMAVDGIRVYALFGNGDLACFDLEGNKVWARNLDVPENHYGHSSSLYTWMGRLLIQYDHGAETALLALDCKTGKDVWKTERDVSISWSSPMLYQFKGKMQIVLNSDPYVTGYDAETGKQLWQHECISGEVGPSPAFWNNRVFTVNDNASLACIDLASNEIAWEKEDDLPDCASPLAVNGYVLIYASFGVLTCYKTTDGELVWLKEFDEGAYSSPVFADGKIYTMDRTGLIRIIEPADEYKEIGKFSLGANSNSTPAFMDGRMIIRSSVTLYCFGK